jgi:hypothetical protein
VAGSPTAGGDSVAAAAAVPVATGAADQAGSAGPESMSVAEPGGTADEGSPSAPAPDTEVTVVPGIARYHRPNCILIRFLGEDDLERMSRADAEAAGSVACRACRP